MKVLMINHFPLIGSGSGTYTRNIAVHLMKKGHEVGIVFPENTAKITPLPGAVLYPVYFTYDEKIEGALPFNFPCFTTHPRSVMTFFDLDDSQLDMYLNAFRAAIKKAVDEFKPDVIHGQHIWLLSWLALETGLPYILTAHGTDLMGYRQSERFRKQADEVAMNAKHIITISNDNDKLVREIFPDVIEKTVFMRNGYDPESFYPEKIKREEILASYDLLPLKYFVLFAGKLAHFKGIDILLDAAAIYEKAYDGEILTLIAGEGELMKPLKEQSERLKLANLHFLGFVDAQRLRALYSAADVSVVPSRREPFGLVAIEALACGAPVVATNQGGLPDIINDKVGSLVDVEDAAGLARAITDEIRRPDRAERGAYAAQYAYKTYAQDSLMEQLIGLLKG